MRSAGPGRWPKEHEAWLRRTRDRKASGGARVHEAIRAGGQTGPGQRGVLRDWGKTAVACWSARRAPFTAA
ncbi:hypothetical protein NDU88_002732 [Pleurodeles waltl]|uniref:Uncharacterized protein n=1 Tax=Pleurodeles waltl TaxID=8319 RepID=A0AAV7RCA5_PLEWA|nr:hypothetical protein NDU88_002732 [Pleurodeles waltl]